MTQINNLLKKPFEGLTRDELKKGIKDKFETLSRFCKLTKRQTADFNMLLRAKDSVRVRELLFKAYEDANLIEKTTIEGELTVQNRVDLLNAITKKHINCKKFCENNPQFTQPWVSILLKGTVIKKTQKVREFALILKVNLDKK